MKLKREVIHKCGHEISINIDFNGATRIIKRLEMKICPDCNKKIFNLIQDGKKTEALNLLHKITNRKAV